MERVTAGYICGGFPEAELSCNSAEDKGGRTADDPAPANMPRRQAPRTGSRAIYKSTSCRTSE